MNFSGMVAGLGHEAIVVVNPDGSATLASFGPAEQTAAGGWGLNEPGQVQTYPLPSIQFGSNRLPTAASYAALRQALAKIENVKPNTVRLNYFKTSPSETANLNAWITQQKATPAQYKLCSWNCADLTQTGLLVGGAITSSQDFNLSDEPNTLFNELSGLSADNQSGSVSTSVSITVEGAIDCTQNPEPAGCN